MGWGSSRIGRMRKGRFARKRKRMIKIKRNELGAADCWDGVGGVADSSRCAA